MPAIDFTTAFARLLHDGILRDEFVRNRDSVLAKMDLRENDRAALLNLNGDDLEQQAQILLRKRLDVVCRLMPATCQQLGEKTWPLFRKFGGACWPKENAAAAHDAHAFCSFLKTICPADVGQSEWNRLNFAVSRKRFAIHWLRRSAMQKKMAMQFFLRVPRRQWHEVVLFVQA